jgi:16S rRNA (guanine966-N2)-methyltransferase
MRITGGVARNINLLSLERKLVRPATDFLRQAVFSSLGNIVIEKNFLDLFAGTGTYGLEALSRGSTGGMFIEKNFSLRPILQRNLEAVSKSIGIDSSCCSIALADAMTFDCQKKFDLIFIDPPYDISRKFPELILGNCLKLLSDIDEARVIFEIPSDLTVPMVPGLAEIKRLGKIFKKNSSAAKLRNSPAALIYGRN